MAADINSRSKTLTAAADWCLSQGMAEEAYESPN